MTTFDTQSSMAALYLWLVFGYLGVMLNCDIQRFIRENAVIRHTMGIIAFYFLFTVIDSSNTSPVWIVFLKTVGVYVLFVLATKSRWQFAVTTLVLLFADQIIKNHMEYLKKKNPQDQSLKTFTKVRTVLLACIVAVVLSGTVEYFIKQRRDHGRDFNTATFFLGKNQCRTAA